MAKKYKDQGLEILSQAQKYMPELCDNMKFLAGIYCNYDVSLYGNVMKFASNRLSTIYLASYRYIGALTGLNKQSDIDNFIISKMLKWDKNEINKQKHYRIKQNVEILNEIFDFPIELIESTIECFDEMVLHNRRNLIDEIISMLEKDIIDGTKTSKNFNPTTNDETYTDLLVNGKLLKSMAEKYRKRNDETNNNNLKS